MKDVLFRFSNGTSITNKDNDEVKVIVKRYSLEYGAWLRENCIITRDGFRSSRDWKIEISNEEAYEMYLESLKDK